MTRFSPGSDGALRVALGAMRLSTSAERNDERSVQVFHAAFDAGVTLVDTADAYCLDAVETGHNERLIRRAVESWNGDRSRIRVATKGGLTRPNGLWIPDGRAKHLIAACEASRRALGVERIHLYQLHAVDPRTPLATSVRALATLERDGLVESIGLCNVTVGQIDEARQIAEIAAVQVELSAWRDESILNGVADYCLSNGIPLLAHRPLGSPQRRRRIVSDQVLGELAAKHAATPFEIALAWLIGLSELMVPVVGSTRVETAASIARAARITLDDDDRSRLDGHFPAGLALRHTDRRGVRLQPDQSGVRLQPDLSAENNHNMGLPGAGKSTVAESFVTRGYARLNRDTTGGTLSALLPELDRLIDAGASRIVLDNTYVSRESRARLIHAAATRGLPVRCVSLETSLEDAQINAVHRMLARHGRLLTPQEIRAASRRDTTAFGPAVQFRYQRELEPPHASEGFSAIDVRPFERQRDPSHVGKAVIVWCDGVLRRSRSGARTLAPSNWSVPPSKSPTARIRQARQFAGAESLSLVSPSSSSNDTSSTPRGASTSAQVPRTQGSRGGSDFNIRTQVPSSRRRVRATNGGQEEITGSALNPLSPSPPEFSAVPRRRFLTRCADGVRSP